MIRNGNTKIKRIYDGAQKVRRVYNGSKLIWSAGNSVIYSIDSPSGKVYTKEVEAGDNCLGSKYLDFEYKNVWQGWTFRGWRESLEASIQNLITQKIMGDDPISLYAVYSMPVSVTYYGNGNTGGSVGAQSGTRFYNNGNNLNPLFNLSAGGFIKTAYSLRQWSAGSPGSNTKYALDSTQAFASSQNLYADWAAVDGFTKNWGTLNEYGAGGDESGTTANFQIDLSGFSQIECCCYMQQGAGAPNISFKVDGVDRLSYSGDRGNQFGTTNTPGWRGKKPDDGKVYDSNYWIDVSGFTGNHNVSVSWSGDNASAHKYVTMKFRAGARTVEFAVTGNQLIQKTGKESENVGIYGE